jgi:hypothetical protein
MSRRTSRRRFLGQSVAIASGFWLGGSSTGRADRSPNEKLNVAFIASGGRAQSNIKSISQLGENLVAFCDVDDARAAKTYNEHPNTPRFRDFRKMLDSVKGIDAVVVSTPSRRCDSASTSTVKNHWPIPSTKRG